MDITKKASGHITEERPLPTGSWTNAPLALVLTLGIAHLLFFFVVPNDGLMRSVGDSLLLSAHGLLSAFLLYRVSLTERSAPNAAFAMRLLAVGQFMHALGDVTWTSFEFLFAGEPPVPSVADLGYLSYYFFVFAGLYLIPQRKLKADASLRFALDIAIVVIASSMLMAYLVLPSLVNDPQELGFGLALASIYPLLNLVLLWLATSTMLRMPFLSISMFLYAASIVALFFADAGFAYLEANDLYVSGASFIDLLFPLNAILVSFAAIARQREPMHRTLLSPQTVEEMLPRETLHAHPFLDGIKHSVSYIWLLVAFTVVIFDRFVQPDPGPGAVLIMLGFFYTVVLVIARQALTVRENALLAKQRQRLLNASLILSRPLELQEASDRVLSEVNSLIASDESFIALFAPDGERVMIAGSRRWMNLPARVGALPMRAHHQVLTQLDTVAYLSNTHAVLMPRDMINAAIALLSECRHELWPSRTDIPVSHIAIAPLISNHMTIGLIFVGMVADGKALFDHAEELAAFGLQAAASVENARLRLDQVLAATVAERTRLSRELHDSVLQSLFGMTLGLRTAREHIGNDDAAADSALDYSLRLAESAHSEMRSLVLELRPESLINEGLLTALRKQSETLLERHQIKLIANIAIDEPKCSIHEKEAIYRVVMEALNNVIKHSASRTVHLMVMSNGRELIVTVSDDGIGFDIYQDYPGHVGLASMRERSTSVGAALEVTSALNSGTTVKVSLPLRRMA